MSQRIQHKTAATLPAPTRGTGREVKRLIRAFEIKAVDDDARTFTGLAAAFSLDQGGDVIMPGAFKRTLADWKRSKGRKIPLIDTHQYGSAIASVGTMTEAKETADGLEATFQFLEDDPTAEAIWKRVKAGIVSGLSIGYETIESRQPSDDDRKKGIWRYLKEVKLLEVSVVAFPMNSDARINLASVKGMLEDFRARGIPADELDEAKQLHEELGALLSQSAPEDDSAPNAEGLAPDDPKRLEMEETYRAVLLRGLDAN